MQLRLTMISITSVALLSGCGSLSKFDQASLKQLTDLKGEAKVWFDECGKKGCHGEKVSRKMLTNPVKDFSKTSG